MCSDCRRMFWEIWIDDDPFLPRIDWIMLTGCVVPLGMCRLPGRSRIEAPLVCRSLRTPIDVRLSGVSKLFCEHEPNDGCRWVVRVKFFGYVSLVGDVWRAFQVLRCQLTLLNVSEVIYLDSSEVVLG
ncbi:hypothetical protein Tco_0914911 [Tanacetum coccineum]